MKITRYNKRLNESVLSSGKEIRYESHSASEITGQALRVIDELEFDVIKDIEEYISQVHQIDSIANLVWGTFKEAGEEVDYPDGEPIDNYNELCIKFTNSESAAKALEEFRKGPYFHDDSDSDGFKKFTLRTLFNSYRSGELTMYMYITSPDHELYKEIGGASFDRFVAMLKSGQLKDVTFEITMSLDFDEPDYAGIIKDYLDYTKI